MAYIYKELLDQGAVLDDWRQANVAPVFKKGEKYDAAYYRPVSLNYLYLLQNSRAYNRLGAGVRYGVYLVEEG